MIAQLRGQILASDDSSVNLVKFFEACLSRHAMIVAFLAVLEMVKFQAVAIVRRNPAAQKQVLLYLVRRKTRKAPDRREVQVTCSVAQGPAMRRRKPRPDR